MGNTSARSGSRPGSLRPRRAAAAAIGLLAALGAGAVQAMAVPLAGTIGVTVGTDCSPWCGSSEARADVMGADGQLAGGRFTGGGAAVTSAVLGGGGFFGKTAAATASFDWWARIEAAPGAGSDPFHLFLDWDLSLFSSHDALLGQAAGGSEFTVTLMRCLPFLPPCLPFTVFEQKRVYTDSVVAGELWDLGPFDRDAPYQLLHISYDVGSAAATTPWIGVYASAIDIGIFDFTLRADDGRAPPLPEPPTPALLLAGLAAAAALQRRRLR